MLKRILYTVNAWFVAQKEQREGDEQHHRNRGLKRNKKGCHFNYYKIP